MVAILNVARSRVIIWVNINLDKHHTHKEEHMNGNNYLGAPIFVPKYDDDYRRALNEDGGFDMSGGLMGVPPIMGPEQRHPSDVLGQYPPITNQYGLTDYDTGTVEQVNSIMDLISGAGASRSPAGYAGGIDPLSSTPLTKEQLRVLYPGMPAMPDVKSKYGAAPMEYQDRGQQTPFGLLGEFNQGDTVGDFQSVRVPTPSMPSRVNIPPQPGPSKVNVPEGQEAKRLKKAKGDYASGMDFSLDEPIEEKKESGFDMDADLLSDLLRDVMPLAKTGTRQPATAAQIMARQKPIDISKDVEQAYMLPVQAREKKEKEAYKRALEDSKQRFRERELLQRYKIAKMKKDKKDRLDKLDPNDPAVLKMKSDLKREEERLKEKHDKEVENIKQWHKEEQEKIKAQRKQDENDRKISITAFREMRGQGKGLNKTVGDLYKAEKRVDRALVQLDDVLAGKRVPDSQMMSDLSAAQTAMVTGGIPPLQLIGDTKYKTLEGRLRELQQWATGKPQPYNTEEVVGQIRQAFDTFNKQVKHDLSKHASSIVNRYYETWDRKPEYKEKLLKNFGHMLGEADEEGVFYARDYNDPYQSINNPFHPSTQEEIKEGAEKRRRDRVKREKEASKKAKKTPPHGRPRYLKRYTDEKTGTTYGLIYGADPSKKESWEVLK
jgi:hypothetical protein